ncbi:MAG TPA: signal peptidase I, partial [Clostridiales bacterium]|nr:signal peptidase I [Clostridiales bacterium]
AIIKKYPPVFVFIAGLFPYKPVAVMSNSMVPDFYRGYIVISKKIKKDDIKEIKVGDILEYQLESNVIIHRVIEIEEKDGTRLFTTKGDNNDFPDMKKVEEKQVLGIVKFKIPYAGYPSVWFSEILFKRKSVVRT